MSIEERKRREAARLREKIVQASLRLFVEQGYEKLSMRKIASMIDYSPGTIYRFFNNKEELLQTIAANTFGEIAARFKSVKIENNDNSLEVLKALIREYIFYCVEHPDMFLLFYDIASFEIAEGVMYENLGDKRYMAYQSWFESIQKSIESGVFLLKDKMRIFLYLWDSVNGYINHRIKYPTLPRKSLRKDVPAFLDLLLGGIVTKRGANEKGGLT